MPHPLEFSVTERTLVLVKPDGVARGLIGEVLGRIERKGFRLVAAELRTLPREIAEAHYAEHAEKPFFGSLVDFITGGPLLAAVVEGPRRDRVLADHDGRDQPGQCCPGHDPRRPRHRDAATTSPTARTHRNRRLARSGCSSRTSPDLSAFGGTRHSLSRTVVRAPRSALPWRFRARRRLTVVHALWKASSPHGQQHGVHRPRHGRRPRHRQHARLRAWPRHRPRRAVRGCDQPEHRWDPRGRLRGQADDRPYARQHRRDPAAEGRRHRRLRHDRADAALLHPEGAQASPLGPSAHRRLRAVRDHRRGAARGQGRRLRGRSSQGLHHRGADGGRDRRRAAGPRADRQHGRRHRRRHHRGRGHLPRRHRRRRRASGSAATSSTTRSSSTSRRSTR